MSVKISILMLPLSLLVCAYPALGWAQPVIDEIPNGENASKIEYFEKHVRPLLVQNCYNCHSANTNTKGGLRVDDRNGLVEGGGRGAALVPGDPEQSLLLKAVQQTDPKLKMPPGKKLPDEDIAILTKWIQDGAAWPEVRIPSSIKQPRPEYDALRKEHWAWQPLTSALVPEVKDGTWPRDDIDRFILAKLEHQNLAPVEDADRLALIRRITFDLTGLPPLPQDVDEFLADESPESFARQVDRLLASAAFGERWGRHWLDLARYGESTGSARNLPYPHAWRYRDYVIAALNSDKPYDLFIREQIAGDLLPASSADEKTQQLVATGFLALGVKDVNQRFKVRFIMDNVDEQIDTVSRTFLALTASCARCHDHKFDPIPTSDYYALAGIFRSTDLCAGVRNKMGGGGLDYYDSTMLISLGASENGPSAPAPEKIEELQRELELAKAEFLALRDNKAGDEKAPNGRPKRQVARQKMNRLQQEFNQLSDPAARGAVAFGVRDSKQVADTEIRIRGEAEKLGPVVPRGFLQLVDIPGQSPVNPQQSGRLELAQWLSSEHNALTQRVIVNRVWMHLFGRGIVQSVDNFGVTGDTPSHPELLDHLAQRFVRDGWSIKRLIRTLVLTRAYQLSSAATPEHMTQDPANRLIWRHSPRRLSAEELRDAMLIVAGKLDPAPIEASPVREFKVIELRNNGPEARKILDQAAKSLHRSVYLPLMRGIVPGTLEAFDFAEQGFVVGSRDTTTVPQQALYLLNDPFVRKQSLRLAERALDQWADDSIRLQHLYRLVLGRDPLTSETERAKVYLSEYERESAPLYATASPPVVQTSPETSENPAAAAASETAAGGNQATAQVVNPDEVEQTDAPVTEETVIAKDARTAAWASFCQALLGAAEFRYLK